MPRYGVQRIAVPFAVIDPDSGAADFDLGGFH